MKIHNATKKGNVENHILTGMILDTNVLGSIAEKWDRENGLFANPWSNMVGKWCVSYYNKHGKAPKRNIQGIFEDWVEKTKQKELVELIEVFLTHLSDNSKKIASDLNPDFVLDLAQKHFNKVQAEKLLETLGEDLENEGSSAFYAKVASINRIEIGQGSTIDLLNSKASFDAAFDTNKRQSLIKYPGEAGYFFGRIFERDALVAFMSPEKTGKSFWLLDVSYRALLQGRKVAVFQVGDLSESQIIRRYGARIAKRPVEPSIIQKPTMLEYLQGEIKLTYDTQEFKTGLTGKECWAATQKLLKKLKGEESPLRLEVHSMNSISVKGIDATIKNWAKDNWIPDVVVIDYADILAPIYGGANVESRQQVNATWQGLRGISQDYHACVVTATQTNAESYEQEVITRRNFSEDKRKNAHVTAMIAINQKPLEKSKGLQRLNIVQLREDYFSPEQQLLVAGCFGIANPMMRSIWYDNQSEKHSKKSE